MTLGAYRVNTLSAGPSGPAYGINRYGYDIIPAAGDTISTAQKKFGNSSLYSVGWPTASNLKTTLPFDAIPDNSNWTIEGWWRPNFTAVNGYIDLLAFGNCSVSLRGWNVTGQAVIEYNILDKSGANRVNWNGNCNGASGTFDTNNWYHFALVHYNDYFYIYGNGTQTSNRGPYTSNYNCGGTSTTIGNVTIGQWWLGYLDEIRISKTARYTTSSFTPSTTGFTNDSNTLLLLKMEGTNGSTLFQDTSV